MEHSIVHGKLHHVADHLWLRERHKRVEFVVIDDDKEVISIDPKPFRTVNEATRAYRTGYIPDVVYPGQDRLVSGSRNFIMPDYQQGPPAGWGADPTRHGQ